MNTYAQTPPLEIRALRTDGSCRTAASNEQVKGEVLSTILEDLRPAAGAFATHRARGI